jgi:adenine-specific DNA-methyltransferase
VSVLKDGEYAKVQREEFQSLGLDANGTLVVAGADAAFVLATPGTQWRISSHDATQYGTRLLTEVILPGSNFPFPKSLYAVADTLRFFVEGKPSAIVLDFFAGSGTTLNAINLLNSLDGGKRQCVMVTNNEVSADEAAELSAAGLKPGDPTWETQGICRSITWPRSKYTILGRRDDGTTIDGEYLTGRPVSTETPRQFTHVAFVSPADFRLGKGQTASTARKRKQGLVSLIDGLPQSAVGDEPYIASEDYPASILFDPEKAEEWLTALDGQDHIERFYIVTERPSDYRNLRERVEDLLGPKVVQEERKLPMSAGFSSNLAYFKLDFLDKNRVELGAAFREILPLLWLKSGSVGQRPELGETTLPHWFAPAGSPFAVLLKESQVAGFLRELVGRTDLTHVFIVTDSEEAFRTLSEEVLAAVLPFNAEVETFQLYRDYLSNFAINTSPEDAALPEVHG